MGFNQILDASLLVSGKRIETSTKYHSGAGLKVQTLQLPRKPPDPNVSVVKLRVAGEVNMSTLPMQQNDGVVTLDGYQTYVHDLKHVPDKPQQPVDQRIFTVMQPGEGIMPAHALTIGGFASIELGLQTVRARKI